VGELVERLLEERRDLLASASSHEGMEELVVGAHARSLFAKRGAPRGVEP
jgi:hypothetical protein